MPNNEMSEIIKREIDEMTYEQMARALRFSPSGSPLFIGKNFEYFHDRFESFGGMTVEVSRRIGWRKP